MKLNEARTDACKFLLALGFSLLGAVDLALADYVFAFMMLAAAGASAYAYATGFTVHKQMGVVTFLGVLVALVLGALTLAVGVVVHIGVMPKPPTVTDLQVGAAIVRGAGAVLVGLGFLFGIEFDLKEWF